MRVVFEMILLQFRFIDKAYIYESEKTQTLYKTDRLSQTKHQEKFTFWIFKSTGNLFPNIHIHVLYTKYKSRFVFIGTWAPWLDSSLNPVACDVLHKNVVLPFLVLTRPWCPIMYIYVYIHHHDNSWDSKKYELDSFDEPGL